jgi:hypothetical protein
MFSASKWSRFTLAGLLLVGLFATSLAIASSNDEITALKGSFRNPPSDSRIMVRWWWFGPSVEKTELERELRTSVGFVAQWKWNVDRRSATEETRTFWS